MSGFDLDAYLERIRLPARPAPDADGLSALQRAHRLAIPFECLDVVLGRGIAIDSDSVFAKLVTARRGGYCFEHNRLFLHALTALGFNARPLLARVLLIEGEVPPLTHTLSLVTIDGQPWIADPGFGGSYTPPMPLVEGAEVTASDGARFRLTHEEPLGWILWRDGDPATTDGRGAGAGFRRQYAFTLAHVWDADLAQGNHWTVSAPPSRFHQICIVSIVLPSGFVSLTDRFYRWRSGAEDMSADITDPYDYRLRLRTIFGIDLNAEEVAGLRLFDER